MNAPCSIYLQPPPEGAPANGQEATAYYGGVKAARDLYQLTRTLRRSLEGDLHAAVGSLENWEAEYDSAAWGPDRDHEEASEAKREVGKAQRKVKRLHTQIINLGKTEIMLLGILGEEGDEYPMSPSELREMVEQKSRKRRKKCCTRS